MTEAHEPPAQTKDTAADAVIVEYRTATRWGETYGLPSVKAALEFHPDAVIVRYQDGRVFDLQMARSEVKEAKAEIRQERQAEREASAPVAVQDAKPKAKADE